MKEVRALAAVPARFDPLDAQFPGQIFVGSNMEGVGGRASGGWRSKDRRYEGATSGEIAG
jgi:hypothetical protein